MRTSLPLGVLAGTTAIAFATLVVAAPAAAATLPAGQKITIVEYLDSSDPGEGQFYDVNPADAASTPVGTASEQVVLGLEVGDDGIGAAIGQLDSVSTIWTADANTGTLSNPQEILLDGETELDNCAGIDLVNGTFIIACVEGGSLTSHVGAVDPATGVFTSFLTLINEDFLEFDALANDTTTAQLWGFAQVEGNSLAFQLNLETDTVTFVSEMQEDVYGADFDRDGQLFVSTQELFNDEFYLPALAVADPTTGAYSFSEPYVSTATDAALIFVASITIWGAEPDEPALAATGSEIAPVAIGSALLLLAGAAVILMTRVSRRDA